MMGMLSLCQYLSLSIKSEKWKNQTRVDSDTVPERYLESTEFVHGGFLEPSGRLPRTRTRSRAHTHQEDLDAWVGGPQHILFI